MKILNKLFPGYKSEKHAFLLKNVRGRTILVIYCLLFLGICFSIIFSNMSEVNYRKTWNDVSNKGAYEKALVEIQKNASTSTFNEKEKSIIAYGKAYNYTREEVENSIIRYRTNSPVTTTSVISALTSTACNILLLIFGHIILSLFFFKIIMDFIVIKKEELK